MSVCNIVAFQVDALMVESSLMNGVPDLVLRGVYGVVKSGEIPIPIQVWSEPKGVY